MRKIMSNDRGCLTAIIGIGVIVAGCLSLAPHCSRDAYTATVNKTAVKRYNKSDKYLIFTKLKDGSERVFENTDSWIEWKFDSSDVYGNIEDGKTYNFKTYGWRFPFMSWYENILSAEEVKNPVAE
jgi:hypothetical protein